MDKTSPRNSISLLRIFYFMIGMVVLIFLLRQIDFRSLIQLIFKIKPSYLVLGGVVYLCKALVRSYRVARLNASTRPSLIKMMRLTLASSLASQILPFKLGELSYVYLLRKEHQSSISQGLSSLVILRIFDLLAISLLFLIISLEAKLPGYLSPYFFSTLGFVAFLLVVLIALLIVSKLDRPILEFVFQKLRIPNIPIMEKLRQGLESLLSNLKQYQWREYVESTLLASLEWLINYVTFYTVLWGIGFSPGFFAVVVSVTFSALASILPINSFGNFGTQEAGWATAMILLGYSKEIAISSGFATHLLTLGYMLLLGGISWLSYWIVKDFPENPASDLGARTDVADD